MNRQTVCNIADIDIYLLFYLDLDSIINLLSVSKMQYNVLSNLVFVKQLVSLKQKYEYCNLRSVVLLGSKHDYLELIKWIDMSINNLYIYSDAIYNACKYGYVSMLEWLCMNTKGIIDNHKQILQWDNGICISKIRITSLICHACFMGHVSILKWLSQSSFNFHYNCTPIDNAAAHGHINILEWFSKSGYEFKYSNLAIDWASRNGHINVLEWFSKSNYKLKYTDYALRWAMLNHHHHIVEWFNNLNIVM